MKIISNFKKEVLKSDLPVIVLFGSKECMPCQMMTASLVGMEKDFEGFAEMMKLDVQEFPEVAGGYSVQSVPDLWVFKEGKGERLLWGYNPNKEEVKEIISNQVL